MSLNSIEEYYNIVGDEYDLNLNDFRHICKAPFRFAKECISSSVLKNVRLQYFGVFEVSKSRVKYFKKKVIEYYEKGLTTKEKYNKKIEMLDSYQK